MFCYKRIKIDFASEFARRVFVMRRDADFCCESVGVIFYGWIVASKLMQSIFFAERGADFFIIKKERRVFL